MYAVNAPPMRKNESTDGKALSTASNASPCEPLKENGRCVGVKSIIMMIPEKHKCRGNISCSEVGQLKGLKEGVPEDNPCHAYEPDDVFLEIQVFKERGSVLLHPVHTV